MERVPNKTHTISSYLFIQFNIFLFFFFSLYIYINLFFCNFFFITHNKNQSNIVQSTTATTNVRNSLGDRINADILLSGRHHHQRDLFTGSLSTPTHVGTVIHAFETMARKSSPPPPVTQSFELQATATSKMLHHRKSLSTAADLYHRPQQSVEHRHAAFDVPPAPPPPVLNVNATLAHRSLSSPSVSEMMVAMPCEYHARTLSHAHAANKSSTLYTEVRQHMPPATMARGAMDRVGGRSDADGSSDALRHSHRTFDARNGGNNGNGNRNIGAAVSVANISYNMQNNSNEPPFYGTTAKNVPAANNMDSIDTGDDYRKNIVGSHPAIESKELRASASSSSAAAAAMPKINYDGSRKIPRPVSQAIRNDSNNNAHKSQPTKRPPTNIYLVRSDNGSYLHPTSSGLAKQFSDNTNNNTGHHFDDNNWNLGEDDHAFLRGSTVSQSFIKNMKNASSSSLSRNPTQANQSTSKKLNSLAERSTNAAEPSSRSYYKPQKYILSDDSQDELRARYTEHSGECNISRAKNKSPPRIFRPAKFSGFGYTRQK